MINTILENCCGAPFPWYPKCLICLSVNRALLFTHPCASFSIVYFFAQNIYLKQGCVTITFISFLSFAARGSPYSCPAQCRSYQITMSGPYIHNSIFLWADYRHQLCERNPHSRMRVGYSRTQCCSY